MIKSLRTVAMAALAMVSLSSTAQVEIDFAQQGYDNGEAVEQIEQDGVTLTFDKGTNKNAPKYYENGTAIRLYGGNSMTVTGTATIKKVEIEFGSSDGSNAITTDVEAYENGTWTGSAESVTFTIGGTSGNRRFKKVTVTMADDSSDTRIATTVTISADGITNTNVYNGTAAGTLTATVAAGETVLDATVTWTSGNTDVATVNEAGVVTLVAAGTTTITAEYAGDDSYKGSKASYQLTVTNFDPNAPGTIGNPYTVAQAIEAIVANEGIAGVYATGTVSKIVTPYNSEYKNISFDISADGTTDGAQLRAYRCTKADGDDAPAVDDVQVGDVVVIYGDLTLYNNSIYEFTAGNTLVSLQRAEDERADANLAWSEATATVTIDANDNVFPTLTNPNGLDVTYSSSDPTAATIDENGNITLQAEGVTTISAAFAGNESYKPQTVSYELTINPAETQIVITGDKYVKVTATDDIESGYYLIVYEEGKVAFDGSLETLDAVGNTIGVTIVDNEIQTTRENFASAFVIDIEAGTLKSMNEKYIGVTSNSNGLKTSDEASAYKNRFSIDEDGNAVIAAVFDGSTMTLRFNSASNQNRFRYYKDNGQKAIQLYKFVDDPDDETATAIATVKAAAANGAAYNLAGQRVAEGYKGLVIVNGKKQLVK